MQLHELQSHTDGKKKRVGRGGRRGKTSGRGHKGQKARAGGTPRPQIRDVIKKLPKLRGYRFKSIKEKPSPVNVSLIQKYFEDGERVSPKTLLSKGIIEKKSGKLPRVKILGDGDVSVKVTVEGCGISSGAREKIEKAGGEVLEANDTAERGD